MILVLLDHRQHFDNVSVKLINFLAFSNRREIWATQMFLKPSNTLYKLSQIHNQKSKCDKNGF